MFCGDPVQQSDLISWAHCPWRLAWYPPRVTAYAWLFFRLQANSCPLITAKTQQQNTTLQLNNSISSRFFFFTCSNAYEFSCLLLVHRMGLINKPVVWWQRASSLSRLALVTSFLEASAGQEVGLLGERHRSGHCRTVEGVDFGSLGAQPEGIQADAGGSLACERGSLDAGQQQYCGVCIQGVRFMWRLKGL